MKVSALILTYNEESNIRRCLESLTWCDDIIVIDSGSTDRTVDISLSLGARVITRPFDCFANQRNFGLEVGDFRNSWVLHLDADEEVTADFVAALDHLEADQNIFAFRIPSKIMLFGRWLRYAGMYPVYQVRLGHRDRLRFQQVGHGQREDLHQTEVSFFNEPYLHHNFSHGVAAWFIKHVRYAKDEVELVLKHREGEPRIYLLDLFGNTTLRRRFLKALASKMPIFMRPLIRFIYVFIVRRGFLDGRAGLAYAMMLSVYEGMIAVFYYEHLMRESLEKVEARIRKK